jgi:hypothetical protein
VLEVALKVKTSALELGGRTLAVVGRTASRLAALLALIFVLSDATFTKWSYTESESPVELPI